MKIITNNPKVRDELKRNGCSIDYFEENYLDILYRGRDEVHKKKRLLTHPLYGSVKPNETVYRTLVIEDNESIDFTSLQLIEEAIGVAEKFLKDAPPRDWPQRILDDFQVIDYDLIYQAISRMIL